MSENTSGITTETKPDMVWQDPSTLDEETGETISRVYKFVTWEDFVDIYDNHIEKMKSLSDMGKKKGGDTLKSYLYTNAVFAFIVAVMVLAHFPVGVGLTSLLMLYPVLYYITMTPHIKRNKMYKDKELPEYSRAFDYASVVLAISSNVVYCVIPFAFLFTMGGMDGILTGVFWFLAITYANVMLGYRITAQGICAEFVYDTFGYVVFENRRQFRRRMKRMGCWEREETEKDFEEFKSDKRIKDLSSSLANAFIKALDPEERAKRRREKLRKEREQQEKWDNRRPSFKDRLDEIDRNGGHLTEEDYAGGKAVTQRFRSQAGFYKETPMGTIIDRTELNRQQSEFEEVYGRKMTLTDRPLITREEVQSQLERDSMYDEMPELAKSRCMLLNEFNIQEFWRENGRAPDPFKDKIRDYFSEGETA